MSQKYKVHANEQFLGHYQAQDGFAAIEKAIKANYEYHPEILNHDCVFSAKKNVLGETHQYTWDNIKELSDNRKVA